MVLDGVDYNDVDSNVKLAMKKALGDTIGVHWYYITTPVVEIYLERKLVASHEKPGEHWLVGPSGQMLRAITSAPQHPLPSSSLSLRGGGGGGQGGYEQRSYTSSSGSSSGTVQGRGLPLAAQQLTRKLSNGIYASFDVSTTSVSDGSAFQSIVDGRMTAAINDGTLLSSMLTHATAISPAYAAVLESAGIDTAGYTILNISPTQPPTSQPTPYSARDKAETLLVGSNAIAYIMLTLIGLLFFIMLIFILHSCGVKIPYLSDKLDSRRKVAPDSGSGSESDKKHKHDGYRDRDRGYEGADERIEDPLGCGVEEGIKKVQLGQVAPDPFSLAPAQGAGAAAPTPDAKQDEIRSAAATVNTSTSIPGQPQSQPQHQKKKGTTAASLELTKLFKGRVMVVAFRLKTSPAEIADLGPPGGKQHTLEYRFNANIEVVNVHSISYEDEAVLSGDFSSFSDDYLMLFLSAVEREQALRTTHKDMNGDKEGKKKVEESVSFELSVTTASGTTLKQAGVMERIVNLYSCSAIQDSGMAHVKFIVTADAPLFVQKSYIMPKATFVVGGSSMRRLLNEELINAYHNKKKQNSQFKFPGEQREMALRGMLANHCHFVVGGGRHGVSRDQNHATLDDLEPPLDKELKGLFHMVADDDDDNSDDDGESSQEDGDHSTDGSEVSVKDDEADYLL